MKYGACIYLVLKIIIVLAIVIYFINHMLIIKNECEELAKNQWKNDNKYFNIQDAIDNRDNFLKQNTN